MTRIGVVSSLLTTLAMTSLAATETSAAVVNGGFEAGNTGFTSGYNYVPTGPSCDLSSSGTYTIGSDPHTCHGPGASFPPHSGSLMMIGNGADQPGVVVWGENVPVAQHTIYHFSVWSTSWDPSATPLPDLQLSINGAVIGDLIISSVAGLWQQTSFPWDSGSNSTANLSIMDLSTVGIGNDFALDDIALTAPVPTPEPASLLLLVMPLAGLCLRRPIGVRRLLQSVRRNWLSRPARLTQAVS